MSFFRSFFGTCRGPYIFHELKCHSVLRTLWHFFLLCFLCSIGIAVGNSLTVRYRWRAAYHEFNDIFGSSVTFSSSGIIPAKDPQISRRQELPFNSLLIYVSPEGPEKEYPDDTLDKRNLIILWSSACIAVFSRQGEDSWQCMAQYKPGETVNSSSGFMDFKEMKKELLELTQLPPSDKWDFGGQEDMDSGQLFSLARLSFACGKAIMYFIISFFGTLFITLFFTVIFRLFNAGKKRLFGFAELWKVALYTAFPVLFVVNMFPALQLSGTGFYDYLFLIGWVGYLFFVLKYLMLNPETDENGKQGESNG